MEQITSYQNPRIKNLLLLQEKSRERRKQNLIVVEGFREFNIALNAGYSPVEVFYCQEVAEIDLSIIPPETRITYISRTVFEKIA